MKKKTFSVVLAILVICFLILWLFNQKERAQEFTLIDLNGQTVTEADYQNKVTLVNFWYPSCPGCDVEMPKLKDLQHQFAQSDYQTIAISLNYNTLEEVKSYTKERELPFIVLYDQDNQLGARYGVTLAPMTFLIDQKGYIIKYYIGEPAWSELETIIKTLLKNK